MGTELDRGRILFRPFGTRYRPRSTFRYFVFNALSELDSVDEYFLDSAAQRVYMLADAYAGSIEAAVAENLLEIHGASHVIIENIAIERSLGDLVRIEDSNSITLRDCLVRNSGARGIVVTGGSTVRITRCVVADIAETGVELSGGDRMTLTPGQHAVEDSIITRFGVDGRTYRPAVQLRGVGNLVRGSLIQGGPHMGIGLSGNDHSIEGNELANLMTETDDGGAIYTGRDYSKPG